MYSNMSGIWAIPTNVNEEELTPPEYDEVCEQYSKLFPNSANIGEYVGHECLEAVERAGGVFEVTKQCIEKGVPWEELLNCTPIELDPNVIY